MSLRRRLLVMAVVPIALLAAAVVFHFIVGIGTQNRLYLLFLVCLGCVVPLTVLLVLGSAGTRFDRLRRGL